MTESDVNILEVPHLDENRVNMDKENFTRQIFTKKTAEMDRVTSCPRTPLRTVNQARDGAVCPVYSPITPVSGARSRTPLSGRKSRTPRNRRKTVCDFRRKQSPMNVMNTLLYNKAKELIEQGLQEERDMRKQLEMLVGTKDEEILKLKAEVNRLSGQPMVASTLQDTISVSLDDKYATTSDCKSSGVDYSKRTKDELAIELEASEIRYRDLHSEFESVHQQYHLLERELARARTARAAEGISVSNAFELVKVTLEQKIANLHTCQSQLRREISEREKEVASCRSELQQREKEVAMLNESLAKSRDDMSRIYEQKQQESELCGEYRNQRQKDIVRMQELESQLNEFAQIRPNIIKARLAQEKLANVIRKAHETALEKKQAVTAETEEFLKQKVEWLKWKGEKEQSLAAIQEECDRIQAVNQRQGGRSQRDLAEQQASTESRIDCLQKQIVCLESSVESEKRINDDLTEKLNLTEKQMASLNEQMAADLERHELEVTNLQRTLDMREHEFDELTKGCNRYKRLVTHLQTQTTKQQAIISKVAELERQIELLEKEKTIVSNEMGELRKKAAELRQLTTDHQVLLEKTQSLETNLIDKEQQMRCKEAELSNAVTVVELLFKKASSFFDKLTSQWRAWNKTSQGVKQAAGTPLRRRSQTRTPVTSGCRRRSRKSYGAPSFVCQILSASKQNAEPHDNKTIPALKLYGSTMEGRSAVEDRIVIGHDEATELTTQVLESEMSPSTRRRGSQDSNCSDGHDVISLHSSSSSTYGERFTSFVDEIATIFTKMESLLHGEVISAFSQLRNLVRSLEGHLSQQQQTHVKQMREAQMAVRQAVAEAGDQQRKADVATQRAANLEDELKEKMERAIQLETLLQNKNDRLIQLTDQATEIKKLSKDLTSVQQKCELKDEEIRLLKSSLNERWEDIEVNPGASATVVKEMDKEIISLKIQKQKLMQDHADDKRKWEESCFRLEEQHRIDMRNLKRAEEAIGQLDEKIERLRLALQPHLNILKADKRLHPILCEIRAFD